MSTSTGGPPPTDLADRLALVLLMANDALQTDDPRRREHAREATRQALEAYSLERRVPDFGDMDLDELYTLFHHPASATARPAPEPEPRHGAANDGEGDVIHLARRSFAIADEVRRRQAAERSARALGWHTVREPQHPGLLVVVHPFAGVRFTGPDAWSQAMSFDFTADLPAVRLVIELEGDCLSAVLADRPNVEVLVIDTATDGVAPADLHPVTLKEGEGRASSLSFQVPDVEASLVATRFQRFHDSGGLAC